MTVFEDKTMYAFEKYLELQRSGELNMVSSEVQARLGISKEEHHFILENYNALLEEYNRLKVVDEVIADAKARSEGKGKDEKSLGFNKNAPEPEKDEEQA